MDFEKLEEILDELVWHTMKTLNDKGVEHHDAVQIMDSLGRFAQYGEFEDFYRDFEYEKGDPGFKAFVKEVVNING